MTPRRTLTVLAAVLALTLPISAAATEDPIVTVEVAWLMPVPTGGWTGVPTDATATWPQTLDTGACGSSWLQIDLYRGRQSAIDAILADGQLTKTNGVPEDSQVVQSWRYVAQAACEPEPTPTPTPEPTPTPTVTPTPTPTTPSPTPTPTVEPTPPPITPKASPPTSSPEPTPPAATPAPQVTAVPVGGVATGDGSTS